MSAWRDDGYFDGKSGKAKNLPSGWPKHSRGQGFERLAQQEYLEGYSEGEAESKKNAAE